MFDPADRPRPDDLVLRNRALAWAQVCRARAIVPTAPPLSSQDFADLAQLLLDLDRRATS